MNRTKWANGEEKVEKVTKEFELLPAMSFGEESLRSKPNFTGFFSDYYHRQPMRAGQKIRVTIELIGEGYGKLIEPEEKVEKAEV